LRVPGNGGEGFCGVIAGAGKPRFLDATTSTPRPRPTARAMPVYVVATRASCKANPYVNEKSRNVN